MVKEIDIDSLIADEGGTLIGKSLVSGGRKTKLTESETVILEESIRGNLHALLEKRDGEVPTDEKLDDLVAKAVTSVNIALHKV